MTITSEPTTQTTGCPGWCVDHWSDGDGAAHHAAILAAWDSTFEGFADIGSFRVQISQVDIDYGTEPRGDICLHLPKAGSVRVSALDARRLAAHLLKAADRLEPSA
jgi:hypothetical protein